MEIMWRSRGDGVDGVKIVWRWYRTRGDGVGADLMAKASRGRVGTYALETVGPMDAER